MFSKTGGITGLNGSTIYAFLDNTDIIESEKLRIAKTPLDNLVVQDLLAHSATFNVKCGLLPNSKQVSYNDSATNRSWGITTPAQDILLAELSRLYLTRTKVCDAIDEPQSLGYSVWRRLPSSFPTSVSSTFPQVSKH